MSPTPHYSIKYAKIFWVGDLSYTSDFDIIIPVVSGKSHGMSHKISKSQSYQLFFRRSQGFDSPRLHHTVKIRTLWVRILYFRTIKDGTFDTRVIESSVLLLFQIAKAPSNCRATWKPLFLRRNGNIHLSNRMIFYISS